MPIVHILLALASELHGGESMNSRTLKKHLKYIGPEMRLALIKEPGGKPVPIGTPDDLEQFVAPLKLYSDYVPRLNMCPGRPQGTRWLEERVFCDT